VDGGEHLMSAAALPLARAPRWAHLGLNALVAGLVCVLALGIALRATGTTALVDYTDSMAPAIHAGDVIVDRATRAADLRPGQVATIADPARGTSVTHRVESVSRTGATVTVVTRGDANDASERWVLPAAGTVRHMVARIPWVGHVMVWLTSPLLRALLLALAALAAAGWGLDRLRRA
jgi:signal peptidase I